MRWPYGVNGDPKEQWHDYFCWWPTLVEGMWVWFEVVERRGKFWCGAFDAGYDWDFRFHRHNIRGE